MFTVNKTEQGMAIPQFNKLLLPVYSEKLAQRVENETTYNTEPIRYISRTQEPLQSYISTQRLMYLPREEVLLPFIKICSK